MTAQARDLLDLVMRERRRQRMSGWEPTVLAASVAFKADLDAVAEQHLGSPVPSSVTHMCGLRVEVDESIPDPGFLLRMERNDPALAL